jgi:hypothetical protein
LGTSRRHEGRRAVAVMSGGMSEHINPEDSNPKPLSAAELMQSYMRMKGRPPVRRVHCDEDFVPPDTYGLMRAVNLVRAGWVMVTVAPGVMVWVHPEKDCTNCSCPQAGTVHKHVPTEAEREDAYGVVTDWLRLQYEREGTVRDTAELERMFALEDPSEQ